LKLKYVTPLSNFAFNGFIWRPCSVGRWKPHCEPPGHAAAAEDIDALKLLKVLAVRRVGLESSKDRVEEGATQRGQRMIT